MWQYSITSPVSSSMISNMYPGGVVCAVVSILIVTLKICTRLLLPTLPHGDFVLIALLIVRQVTFNGIYGI